MGRYKGIPKLGNRNELTALALNNNWVSIYLVRFICKKRKLSNLGRYP
jgi:hypothetical protein